MDNYYGSYETEYKDYPKLECKTVSFKYLEWMISIPIGLIFLFPVALIDSISIIEGIPEDALPLEILLNVCMPLVAAAFNLELVESLYGYLLIRLRGKCLRGTVLGYDEEREERSRIRIDGLLTWKSRDITVYNSFCFISFDTEHGKRMVEYTITTGDQPYLRGEEVELWNYGKYYYIKKRID